MQSENRFETRLTLSRNHCCKEISYIDYIFLSLTPTVRRGGAGESIRDLEQLSVDGPGAEQRKRYVRARRTLGTSSYCTPEQ